MLKYSAKPPTIAPTRFAPKTLAGKAVFLNVLENTRPAKKIGIGTPSAVQTTRPANGNPRMRSWGTAYTSRIDPNSGAYSQREKLQRRARLFASRTNSST